MKTKIFKFFIIASTPFYAFTLIGDSKTPSDWDTFSTHEEHNKDNENYADYDSTQI